MLLSDARYQGLPRDNLLNMQKVFGLGNNQVQVLSESEKKQFSDIFNNAQTPEDKMKIANFDHELTQGFLASMNIKDTLQQNIALHDKSGEAHYNIISAFIKSIRGSDPNGAVYWLARMIEGGEDVKFIARRMLILSSEDIGNANPTAFIMANNTFQAVSTIGNPESRIILSQCAIYLATSPKSNASYMAIGEAQAVVKQTGDLSVPIHLRNAPTKLMKELGYGEEYQYSHNYPNNFSEQEYLPDELKQTAFYKPGNNARENELRTFLKNRWKDKYGY